MSAMPEELEGLESLILNKKKTVIGMRTYYEGEINGIKMVMVFSRWGKVAAATTATTLFLKFGITELIFTGVAGAIQNKLNIGDIVLGTHFIQHDMDARPFIKQFELPLLNISYIESPEEKIDQATSAVQNLLDASYLERLLGNTHMAAFNISQPRLYAGFIASGDKFISTEADRTTLNNTLPAVLCVEMEGAAVAQVCYENKIPFIIFRTISDNANESAPIDFQQFVKNVAQKYSFEFINRLFKGISSENTDQKY
ncbi:adenosylhomocysteine nucleosidase [Dyadobacter jejuensis]|uniref:adenosylhomocysteine nucleosidase n=2 Tax=Dyadobacter jejuensis TaxID=1082580 RepID=A0A316ANJ2_9BACT|nr:adenosylhomocysteine nucleosidase [Dyadobacter jejuensis]